MCDDEAHQFKTPTSSGIQTKRAAPPRWTHILGLFPAFGVGRSGINIGRTTVNLLFEDGGHGRCSHRIPRQQDIRTQDIRTQGVEIDSAADGVTALMAMALLSFTGRMVLCGSRAVLGSMWSHLGYNPSILTSWHKFKAELLNENTKSHIVLISSSSVRICHQWERGWE